jgi:hypothetical protein
MRINQIPAADSQGNISQELSNALQRSNEPERYTTAQIEDSTAACNRNKYTGKHIINATTNRPLWASGNALTSAWHDGSGNVVHTVT